MERLWEWFERPHKTAAFSLLQLIQRYRVKIYEPWVCINTVNDQNNSLAVIHPFVLKQVNVSTVRKGKSL